MSGPPDVDTDIPGDLLSCFGTALAGLQASLGLPWESIIGCQLFTGVRRRGDGFDFLHHHTPLTGAPGLFSMPLRRRGSSSWRAAGAGIEAGVARDGAVVVTSRNRNLAWVPSANVPPAPHWLLVRRGPRPGAVDVVDPFSWVDEDGEHEPHVAVYDGGRVGRLAHIGEPMTDSVASRERWALGTATEPETTDPDPDKPETPPDGPWQWLEPAGRPDATDRRALTRAMLRRTAAGEIADAAVAAVGWTVGAEAFSLIEAHLAAGGSRPETYEIHNDLWVAARARRLFRRTLTRPTVHGVLPPEAVASLTDMLDRDILKIWDILLKTMHYSAVRVSLGHPPRRSVAAHLERLGAAEARLRASLAAALAPGLGRT
jgi:hypothetical protein